ncbi:MAG: hypothetical protein C4531_10185 [Desulfurivibrio sp.]|nr:MAG: hypothetical protein C4531_10185 [Desulfurivibrio sp.]
MPRTAIALLTAVAFVLAGMIGCSREKDQGALPELEEIVLAVTPWPASAALYVALEKGYFREEGLSVTTQSHVSGHLGLEAVLAGRADLATSGETPIARRALDGKPLMIVATVAEIDRAIMVIARKDRGISSADHLRGKKIGLVAGTTADFFLHIYLTTSYINPREVRIVNLATGRIVEALLNGEVDAVSTWSPYTGILRDELVGNACIVYNENLYTMTWNITATRDFVKNNPERLRKFLRALVRANGFVAEQPEQARAIALRYLGTDSALFAKDWQDYHFAVQLDQSLILTLEDQARWMLGKQTGDTRGVPNFLDFIHVDALQAVQPQAVTIAGH